MLHTLLYLLWDIDRGLDIIVRRNICQYSVVKSKLTALTAGYVKCFDILIEKVKA